METEQQEEKKAKKPKKEKIIATVGKRKRAVARATIRQGKGFVQVNNRPLDSYEPRYVRMRIQEPLIIAGALAENADISVNVSGGGIWGQADAARTAIANALVQWSGGKKLQQLYHEYDRSLLVSDPRRTEPHKPSRSTAGPRRKKQQSKR
ncbi:MAG: 30S ribosomal protein S9 [Candidatus Aenigmarchaeota archaeon]|nr:30S ribosomal protein S9 [Candidatus Aenigmarchaeota archaeon]